MNILMVSNKCPPDYDGGYELRAFQIANALRARGHQVDFATSFLRDGFVLKEPEPKWVHRIFRYVPISSKSGIARKLDAAWRRILCTTVANHNVPAMEQFLDGREYDLAYCFGLHRISLASALPITRRGIPILWHAGGTYILDQLHRWPRENPAFRLAMATIARKWHAAEREVDYDSIAFVSEFLREHFAQHGMRPRRSWVISRGADFPPQRDVDRERAVPSRFFMASRLDREKGIDTAIRASGFLLLARPHLDWRLEIAGTPGDSAYRRELDNLISAAGLDARVSFLGKIPREHVLARMRHATAFLSCSRYGEPFAGTIIETLASGTPLLGSIDGSIQEVVEHEKSALLFDKDDPKTLAQHMQTILEQPAKAQDLALAGIKVIEQRYTLDRILDQTEAAFAEVVGQRPAGVGIA